jgi:L-seryl-tRNA(Ser) seleniumtransferase
MQASASAAASMPPGALTRLGGAVMAPEVIEAMAAASRASVDIGELQDAASQRIAEATGAEAGLVTDRRGGPH